MNHAADRQTNKLMRDTDRLEKCCSVVGILRETVASIRAGNIKSRVATNYFHVGSFFTSEKSMTKTKKKRKGMVQNVWIHL